MAPSGPSDRIQTCSHPYGTVRARMQRRATRGASIHSSPKAASAPSGLTQLPPTLQPDRFQPALGSPSLDVYCPLHANSPPPAPSPLPEAKLLSSRAGVSIRRQLPSLHACSNGSPVVGKPLRGKHTRSHMSTGPKSGGTRQTAHPTQSSRHQIPLRPAPST